MTPPRDTLLSIIYSSTATAAFDESGLDALLAQCRENNAAADLTGMLLYRDGRFLQVLEGPEEPLRRLMDVLATDERHTGLRVLFEEPLTTRQFPNWTMGFQRAGDGDGGSGEDGDGGSDSGSGGEGRVADVPGFRHDFDDLDRNDPTATVRALQELVRWFQRRADR